MPADDFAKPDIAIVDTAFDVSPFVQQLKARGVRAVGRYYTRHVGHQGIANNSTDGKPEAQFITGQKINILSVYQYNSGSLRKFEDAANEAALDAAAAIDKAHRIGQPAGTVIYFGVDFQFHRNDRATDGRLVIDHIVEYFKALKANIAGRFTIGAYGDGFVQTSLLGENDLITHSWVSASTSYEDTLDFLKTGPWHLFQDKTDLLWFPNPGCKPGLGIDTNIQRKASEDVGFWGGEPIPADRTATILQNRRFAKRKTAILDRQDGRPITTKRCIYNHDLNIWELKVMDFVLPNRNVRVFEESNGFCHVDIDEDGVPDGYCASADLEPLRTD